MDHLLIHTFSFSGCVLVVHFRANLVFSWLHYPCIDPYLHPTETCSAIAQTRTLTWRLLNPRKWSKKLGNLGHSLGGGSFIVEVDCSSENESIILLLIHLPQTEILERSQLPRLEKISKGLPLSTAANSMFQIRRCATKLDSLFATNVFCSGGIPTDCEWLHNTKHFKESLQ